MGFELGNLSGWDASRGCNPSTDNYSPDHKARKKPCYEDVSINGVCCPVNGPATTLNNASVKDEFSRHTLCNSGMDEFGGFSITPPPLVNIINSGFSLRLGNAVEHGEAERLIKEMDIDSSNAILAYEYAFVHNDHLSHHAQKDELPYFEIKVFNSENGNEISCNSKKYIGTEGFDSVVIGPDPYDSNENEVVYFQSWQTDYLDLTDFIGTNVKLEFTNTDCASGFHWGYTYLAVGCKAFNWKDTVVCANQEVELKSPFPVEGFKLKWSNGDTTENVLVSPSQTTTYTLAIENRRKDSALGSCEKKLKITVFVIDSNTPELSDTSICSGNAITITALPSGINYRWYTQSIGGTPFSIGSNYTTHPLNKDTHFFVENPFDCNNDSRAEVYVDVKELEVNAGLNDTICLGDSIKLNGSGTGNFKWTPSSNLNNQFIAKPFAKPTETMTYMLQVSDDNGDCFSQDLVTIVVENIKVVLAAQNVCLGETMNFSDSLSGNFENINRLWNFGDGQSSQSQKPSHVYRNAGEYVVDYNVSGNVCKIDDKINVEIYEAPKPGFVSSPWEAEIGNPKFDFIDQTVGASKGFWYMGDGVKYPYSPGLGITHEYTINNNLPGPFSYSVRLNVENQFNCKAEIIHKVSVKNIISFYIPNSFTPNGDALNDEFRANGIGIKSFKMTVFNRWGIVVYDSQKLDEGWNGNLNGSGVPANSGVYLWKIRMSNNLDSERVLFGKVNLLR